MTSRHKGSEFLRRDLRPRADYFANPTRRFVAHPVDSRLLDIARHKAVNAAKRAGIACKQTFAKEGKELRRKAGGYAHAKQFRRLGRTVKRQRTVLGIVMREVRRKLAAPGFA